MEGAGSPDIFVEWSVLWMITSAVERNVYVYTRENELYPNLFLLFASPAGGGKSIVLKKVIQIIKRAFHDRPNQRRLAYENMSGAAMVDVIRNKDTNIRQAFDQTTGKPYEYGGLSIVISDLQTLLTEYDRGLIATLTRLYDCEEYSEGRRTDSNNTFELENTYLTMIAGSPPDQIMDTVPEVAWGWGFMPRTIIIGSPATKPPSLFLERDRKHLAKLQSDITHDLQWLYTNAKGRIAFDSECQRLVGEFHDYGDKNQGGPPIPTHPRLLHYNTRRPAHLLKIIQTCVLDEYQGGKLIATAEHYNRAYELLITAESTIPEVFKSSGTGGDMGIIKEVFNRLDIHYRKHQKPFPHARVVALFLENVQSWRVEALIDTMVKQGLLEKKGQNMQNVYIPHDKDPFEGM